MAQVRDILPMDANLRRRAGAGLCAQGWPLVVNEEPEQMRFVRRRSEHHRLKAKRVDAQGCGSREQMQN